jgi:hypothetical protein
MAFQRLRIRRIFRAGACGAALLSSAAYGQAAPKPPETEAQACKTAYTKAEESEQAGRLREAKDLLLMCTKSGCGRLLEQECRARYTRLESDIPTIVLHVIAGDKSAPPPDELQIRMDGALLTSRLDEPMAVDPGVHEFAIRTADGMVEVSRKVMILQGDVNRPVALSLLPGGETQGLTGASATRPSDKPQPSEPEESPPPSGPTALPFLLGGVGLAGVGVGTAFLIAGQQNTWNLAVDSLAVGAGALVGAIWLFARPHSREKAPPKAAAYMIDVRPVASGGMATLSAVF